MKSAAQHNTRATTSLQVAGTLSPLLMHCADWLPTLVQGVLGGSLAGRTLPLDGVDQWLAITTGATSGQRTEVVHTHNYGSDYAGLTDISTGVMWKLVRHARARRSNEWE
jgi:hypothetical protein